MTTPCQYKECKAPAEANSEFCIFHAPSPKDVEKFEQALTSQINEEGPEGERNGRYSFRGYVFPLGIAIDPSRVELIRLPKTIEGDASFGGATIGGDAWFGGVTIEGDASFGGATIKGKASFGSATIEGNAWFGDVTIEGDASFGSATIEGDAWFGGATIEGKARFSFAKIEGKAWFGGATIEGDASFNQCVCSSLLLGSNKPRIRGWGNERWGIFIADPRGAASFWRFAQRIFSRTGEREKADAAFYFERLNHWRELRRATWVMRPGYWVLFLLDLLFVRWTTAYGASVARLFFTWFAVISGFGVIFSMLPRLIGRAGEQIWTLRNWIIGTHYSATTFATLGLGRINPGGSQLGMVLTSIEAILGAVLVALAVLVIGRRFMRQG